ncbi:MAG TPA: sugar ABC transporter substrate-binding protein [Spirochaetota bacterium]|nr:sugar ABC transporter substrate-binding protein [Spirochaetota bacterium]
MKNKILKYSTIVLALVFLLSTVNCTGRKNSKKRLGVMLWAAAEQQPLWKRIKKDFEKKHTNIQIQYYMSSWRGYKDKLLTRLSAENENIDLVKVPNLGDLASRDVLVDLKPYFNGNDLPRQDAFLAKAIDRVTVNKRILAFPYGIDSDVFIINKDIFNKRGVDIPQGNYTFAKFKLMVKKLSSGSDKPGSKKIYGFGMDVHPSRYIPLIKSMGGSIYNPKTKRVNFDTPETRKVLKMLYNFIENGYMPPLDNDMGGTVNIFQQGSLAIFLSGKYLIPELHNVVPFKWDVMRTPSAPGVTPVTSAQEASFGVVKTTKKLKAALSFLKFICSDQGYKQLIRSGEYTPAIKEKLYSEDFLKQGSGKNKIFIDNYLNAEKFFYEYHKSNKEIEECFNSEVWSYLLMQKGGLDQFIHNVNKKLSEFYKIKK